MKTKRQARRYFAEIEPKQRQFKSAVLTPLEELPEKSAFEERRELCPLFEQRSIERFTLFRPEV